MYNSRSSTYTAFASDREFNPPSFTFFILRIHYVPGGPGRPVCSKRSVPWNFGQIFLCFQDLLRLVILRCITISITSRGSDKPVCHGGAKVRYGYPLSISIISTFYYGLLRSVAVSCVLTKV